MIFRKFNLLSASQIKRYKVLLFSIIGFLILIASLNGKNVACWSITQYQKYISPYKGYRCAYGILYGESCSTYGKRVIEEEGFIKGCILLNDRFKECNKAALVLKEKEPIKAGFDPCSFCLGGVAGVGCCCYTLSED